MVLNQNIIIGISVGVLAYTIVNIGKGFQKYGIEGIKDGKKIKSKNSGVWILGTILTSIYMFVQWIALLFAPINIIAPLEAYGLIVFVFFSYFVLKEKISKIEICGIIGIIIGVVMITLFNPNTSNIQSNAINEISLLFISLILLTSESILILISKSKEYRASGLILGITAGTFMALQTVSKRITAAPENILKIVFGIITLIMGLLTFLFTQFAFAKSKANRVIPCFTSSSIIIAIVIGVVSLNEEILAIQIVGIVIILIGSILLTAFRTES